MFLINCCNYPFFALLIESPSPYADVSTQPSMLACFLPSFLETYTLSMSSLRCKAKCIVINLLVLWSFCLFLVYFKNVSYKKECPGVSPFEEISDTESFYSEISASESNSFDVKNKKCLIPYFGVHQAPSDKFSPATQVLSRRKKPGTKLILLSPLIAKIAPVFSKLKRFS